MTWVQNVDKRTRFTEMSNKPHEKVRGGRQFPLPTGVSVSARPVPPTTTPPPACGSEAGTACDLFLLVPVPLRAHFGHRDSASGSVQAMALLALAPSADSRRLLLFLCFLFSVSVHFKN